MGAGGRPRETCSNDSRTPRCAREIKAETVAHHPRRAWRRRPQERAVVSSCEFGSIARRQETWADSPRAAASTPTLENAAETALWIVEQGGCAGHLPRHQRRRPAAHPRASGDHDRAPTARFRFSARNRPHPRSYGTFARVLGVYVRDKKLITLEDRGAEDVGVSGAAARPRGSRRAPAGTEGRHRRLRSGARCATPRPSRSRTRTPKASARHRQRRGRVRERHDDGGTAGPSAGRSVRSPRRGDAVAMVRASPPPITTGSPRSVSPSSSEKSEDPDDRNCRGLTHASGHTEGTGRPSNRLHAQPRLAAAARRAAARNYSARRLAGGDRRRHPHPLRRLARRRRGHCSHDRERATVLQVPALSTVDGADLGPICLEVTGPDGTVEFLAELLE